MDGQSIPFTRASLALLSCFLLAASGARATSQDFPDQEIREVGTGTRSADGAEGIYIVTANADNSVDGCGARFFLEAGHPLLNQNLALALSALYGRSRVHLQVDGCQGAGAMRLKGIRVAR